MIPSSINSRLIPAVLFIAGLLLAAPAAASGFACINPTHHDGDAIHCAGADRSDRMFGIDAPEMPGACRAGRQCTPGDPFAARDHLAALTAGRSVTCEQVDTDHFGRRVVRCAADGKDLSCGMVAGGFAVERYGRLNCGGRAVRLAVPPRPVRLRPDDLPAAELSAAGERPQRRIYPGDLVDDSPPPPRPAPERTKLSYVPPEVRSTGPAWALFVAWLMVANVAAYGAFAIDKDRARAGLRGGASRIPEAVLLGLAAIGGSIGAVFAQRRLRHKTQKQPFATYLVLIIGAHIGAIIGAAILLL